MQFIIFSCVFLLIVATLIDRSIGDDCRISNVSNIREKHYEDSSPDSSKPTRFILNLERYIICENVVLSKDFHKKIHQFFDIPMILGLQITNSNSSTISAGAFSSLSMIPELKIIGANVQTIEYEAFAGLTLLHHLSVCNNTIYKLEKQRFSNLSMLLELDLSNNYMSVIDKRAFYNLTQLEKLIISQNLLLDLPTTVFGDLKNLKSLDLSSNVIIRLDKDIFKNLTNLENLVLDDNHLEILSKNVFASNTKLTFLYINNNFLLELNDIVFPQSLRVVQATHNLIERVKFANNTKIKNLDLSHNKLVLNSKSFDNLEVEWLYLSNNLLGKSSNLDNTFRNILTLERVWLDHNELSSLSSNTFKHNNLLTSIRLSDNKLHNLVEFPKGLEDLLLSNNFLSSFDDLRHIDSLKLLDFSSNKITSISYNSLDSLENLRTLILKKNQLSTIAIGSFRGMDRLLQLDLSYNNLTFVELGTFAGAKRMTEIDLSHNELNMIHDGLLYNLKDVETINLSHNNISFISFINAKSYLTFLKHVILDGNPLSCSNILEIIEELDIARLVEGGNKNVSNVHGIACRNEVTNSANESTEDLVIVVDSWVEEIILKQRSSNAILILFVVVLILRILVKHFWSHFEKFYNFLKLQFAEVISQQDDNSGETSVEEMEMI